MRVGVPRVRTRDGFSHTAPTTRSAKRRSFTFLLAIMNLPRKSHSGFPLPTRAEIPDPGAVELAIAKEGLVAHLPRPAPGHLFSTKRSKRLGALGLGPWASSGNESDWQGTTSKPMPPLLECKSFPPGPGGSWVANLSEPNKCRRLPNLGSAIDSYCVVQKLLGPAEEEDLCDSNDLHGLRIGRLPKGCHSCSLDMGKGRVIISKALQEDTNTSGIICFRTSLAEHFGHFGPCEVLRVLNGAHVRSVTTNQAPAGGGLDPSQALIPCPRSQLQVPFLQHGP